MAERVLCEGEIRVAMDGGGSRTMLSISDGTTLRFWTETTLMESVLQGNPLQLSTHGGYCLLQPDHGKVTLEYTLEGLPRRRCEIPSAELDSALRWVRSLDPPT